MFSPDFFIGHGKFTYWYITFYLIGFPLYLFGLYLLIQIHQTANPQTREFVLTIFSFGYLLLGIASLINTVLYMKVSGKIFWALFVFLGVQVIFWMIGNMLGNNYPLLFLLFLLFLFIVIYLNLRALQVVQRKHHHKEQK